MLPGEVEVELSPRVFEDFLLEFLEHVAQNLLLFLGRQLLDLPFNLFNCHGYFPLLSYLARYIISNYAKGIL